MATSISSDGREVHYDAPADAEGIVPLRQTAVVLDSEQFWAMSQRYPLLSVYESRNGLRYLVDDSGRSRDRRYVDAASIPSWIAVAEEPYQLTEAANRRRSERLDARRII